MQELVKSLMNQGVQAQVRRSMRHVSSFQATLDLPECLLSKLEKLDQVFAEYEAKKA